jgi:hypothetical protein
MAKQRIRKTPGGSKGFIVSNDILERVVCTLIVSQKCACYIQLRHRRNGRGNFQI